MSTRILTKEDLLYLQERFSNFYDFVIEFWSIDWVEDRDIRIKSQIRVRDYEKYLEDKSEVW